LCAVNARSIVGPVFLFNGTINCERYVQSILGHFFPELAEEEEGLCGWFQQDLATSHTARICTHMQALSDVFGVRIISCSIWPARSPGFFTLLDYFFL
jgi:hypothetical protein